MFVYEQSGCGFESHCSHLSLGKCLYSHKTLIDIDKMISFDVKQVYSVANILFFTLKYYVYL